MIPTEGLIDKYGPLIVIAIAAYNVLPLLVKEVMGVVSSHTQSRAKVAEAPYDIMNTVLSQGTRYDLIAIELIGMRAKMDGLETTVNQLKTLFEEFIKKESK